MGANGPGMTAPMESLGGGGSEPIASSSARPPMEEDAKRRRRGDDGDFERIGGDDSGGRGDRDRGGAFTVSSSSTYGPGGRSGGPYGPGGRSGGPRHNRNVKQRKPGKPYLVKTVRSNPLCASTERG